jgi:hypothetical protein
MRSWLLVSLVMGVMLSAWGCSESSTDNAAVVESYISAYNDGDLEAVMTHFDDESSIIGHPTSIAASADGVENIERLHRFDFVGETYTISNVAVDEDTVTWDSVWGEDGCVRGHTAVVADGVIRTWTWGEFVDCTEIT